MKHLILLLLIIPAAIGATIEGTVYDFELNNVEAVIEVNTSPIQKKVAKNGFYSFELPPGKYVISAKDQSNEYFVEENISITENGTYVVDLILFPTFDFEEGEELEVPPIESLIQEQPVHSKTSWLIWIVVFALLGYVVYKVSRPPIIETIKEVKGVPVNRDLQKILDLLDEKGGRATQKEVRKILPYSEAKISLMVAELEDKRLVRRIKKGRENILIKT